MRRRLLLATETAETHLVHMQVARLLEQMLFLSEAGARRAAAIVPIAVPLAAEIARAVAMDIARAFAAVITKAAITVSATVTAAMDTTTFMAVTGIHMHGGLVLRLAQRLSFKAAQTRKAHTLTGAWTAIVHTTQAPICSWLTVDDTSLASAPIHTKS